MRFNSSRSKQQQVSVLIENEAERDQRHMQEATVQAAHEASSQ
jgi:hypothetical protein